MIYAVLVGLRGTDATRIAYTKFARECWARDIEPEFADASSFDPRSDGVDLVPTFRVYADDDPWGEPLTEHRGAATGEQIRALLERGRALA